MKRSRHVLLVLLLLAAPAAVQAQFSYITNADNTLTITNYTGPGGAVIIPGAINGLTVTTIGSGCGIGLGVGCDGVFNGNYVTSVMVPASITNIGGAAFENCYNLASVFFQGNAPTVGSSVFSSDNYATIYYLYGATGWSTNFAGLTAEVLPYRYITNADNSITITEYTGFSELVIIPDNFFGLPVSTIGDDAFSGASLISVTIPNSITNIGDDAFEDCDSLASVWFNGNAPTANSTVFYGDNNATIYYLFGATGWRSLGGGYLFAGLPSLSATAPFWFNYTTNAGAITIAGYIGPGGAIIIPDVINGLPVTSIGQTAFQGCSNLTSITIPGCVTSIPGTTDELGGGTPFVGGCTNLTNVTLLDGVTSIGQGAFVGLGSLINITIPNSVTNIGGGSGFGVDGVFQGCTGITSITIPYSVSSIENQTFENCSNLASVFFQGNAPTVGSSVFSGDNYATIYYLPGATGWNSPFAGLTAEVLPYRYITNADNSITITGYTGFGGLVNIPANFFGLPVTSIGDYAFSGASLTGITIPNSITNIGDDAFQDCTSLATIYFQGNAPTADATVFAGDINATIYYSSSATGWNSPFAGLTAEVPPYTYTTNAGAITITGYTGPGGAVVIPDVINGLPVTTIGTGCGNGLGAGCDDVFANNNVTSVTVPAGVTSIGIDAFYECGRLTSVILPNSITNIGSSAFQGCSNITSVTIPNSVTSIGNSAYQGCTNLFGIYFQGNAPTVGSSVFSGDTNATIYYLPGTTGWSTNFAGLTAELNPFLSFIYTTNAGAITITGYTGPGGAVIIPNAINGLPVTSIGTGAFAGCSNLTSVTISNNITSVGVNAFQGCAGLTSVTIGDSVTHIGDDAFLNCTNLTSVYFSGNAPTADSTVFANDINATVYYSVGTTGWSSTFDGLPTVLETWPSQFSYTTNAGAITITRYSDAGGVVIIPSAINGLPVTSIGTNAFGFCTNLTSVTMPDSVTSIGNSAFALCLSLTAVTIGSGVTSIGERAFTNCTRLTNVTISDSVTNIGQGAFGSCTSLPSVTIPGSVISIGESLFKYCTSLTNVTLSTNITSIGDETFYFCTNLFSVTIPNSVTSIGNSAFAFCMSLTAVTIGSGVTSIGQWAFEECTNLTSITIPNSVTSIGAEAFAFYPSLSNVFFAGNAPSVGYEVFGFYPIATAYYLPGMAGWSSTFAGIPALLWNPLIQASGASFGISNNQFGFNITGTTNFTVVVEACTNLANPVWTPLQTITMTNSSYYFCDPQWTNYPGRFYGLGLP